MEHKSFFRTHKVLAFLPLLFLGAGVWYFIHGRVSARRGEDVSSADLGQPARAPRRRTAPPPLPAAYDPEAGLDIQGGLEFKSQVTHALKLVWMADRGTFLFIKRNVSVIRNENKTGFYMEGARPVAALSSRHAFRSLTWCAGVIAHQAWHAGYKLNSGKKRRRAPPLPGENDPSLPEANPAKMDYKGMDAILYSENRAFAFQLAVLRKVGAPGKETGLVSRRARRDFSAGHDGSYSLNP